MKKRIISVFTIFLLLVMISFITNWWYTPNPTREFSLEIWESEPEERLRMVDDLLEKYDLIGMSKNEIISFLGEPSIVERLYRGQIRDVYLPDGRGKVINYSEGNKIMYYLREGGDAPTYLYIELDENDVGTNIYVVNSQT